MSDRLRDFERTATEMARTFAARRTAAVENYSDILTRFGRGELDNKAYAEALVRLALDETARYYQDVAAMGADYYRTLFSLAGVETGGKPAPAKKALREAKPTPKAPKSTPSQ